MKKLLAVLFVALFVGLAIFLWWQKSGNSIWDSNTSLTAIDKSDPGLGVTFNLEFVGSYVSLDKQNFILTLKGDDSKEYRFLIPDSMLMYGDNDLYMLQPDQGVKVLWNDSRSMKQVLAEYEADQSKPLNEANNSISITGDYDESEE